VDRFGFAMTSVVGVALMTWYIGLAIDFHLRADVVVFLIVGCVCRFEVCSVKFFDAWCEVGILLNHAQRDARRAAASCNVARVFCERNWVGIRRFLRTTIGLAAQRRAWTVTRSAKFVARICAEASTRRGEDSLSGRRVTLI